MAVGKQAPAPDSLSELERGAEEILLSEELAARLAPGRRLGV